ncbi:hypothetical protein GCM10010106_06320 [Thermopolyspora flexuosa]|nr:hypothetical protein GCM10010106_06320 [Thermopolyspora flexuosa]
MNSGGTALAALFASVNARIGRSADLYASPPRSPRMPLECLRRATPAFRGGRHGYEAWRTRAFRAPAGPRRYLPSPARLRGRDMPPGEARNNLIIVIEGTRLESAQLLQPKQRVVHNAPQ